MTLASLVLCCAATLSLAAEALTGNGVTREGWLILFDGTEMSGWAHTGGGAFQLDPEDRSMETVGKTGITFYYDRKFKDFTLQLEWRTSHRTSNSGVFIRFPNFPRITVTDGTKRDGYLDAAGTGYEVQLFDPGPPDHRTGTIIPGGPCEKKAWKDVGEWNRMEITARGQKYTVSVNGVLVNTFEGTRALEGYIGVQNHDLNTKTYFRNMRIKELK
jgi:hypothetical protein